MFGQKNIITAIEIGTSKVAVLVGEMDEEDTVAVIGFHTEPSNGNVCKGEISDMERLKVILNRVISAADQASGHMIRKSSIYIAVTGSGIISHQGEGMLRTEPPEYLVTEADVEEVLNNATVKYLHDDLVELGRFNSFYRLDGERRVSDPSGQKAHTLEANVHFIYGDEKRIDNFCSAVYEVGLDIEAVPMFSAIADWLGVLSSEEREHGVLLVDMGAGTTEYLVAYNNGIMLSGVIAVGMEHLANDLALGLNLNMNSCRKLLQDKTIVEQQQLGAGFLKISDNNLSNPRKIPLNSIETIIDLRMREIFEIVKKRVVDAGLYGNLNRGAVLTGGVALFDPAINIFKRVFDVPVRIGRPFDANGGINELEDPRYSTLWGVLKCGELDVNSRHQRGSLGGSLVDYLGTAADRLFKRLDNTRKAIKF